MQKKSYRYDQVGIYIFKNIFGKLNSLASTLFKNQNKLSKYRVYVSNGIQSLAHWNKVLKMISTNLSSFIIKIDKMFWHIWNKFEKQEKIKLSIVISGRLELFFFQEN